MITFRLLDYTDFTTSKENIIQINPNHIVSMQCEIGYEYIDDLASCGYVAYTSYELVNGKQLQTVIIGLEGIFDRNQFNDYVRNSLNFEVIYFNWSS